MLDRLAAGLESFDAIARTHASCIVIRGIPSTRFPRARSMGCAICPQMTVAPNARHG